MWTSSKTEYREKLAETMMRLGANTTYCYVLVDASVPTYPISYCNEAYSELTGYTNDELVGINFNALFSQVEKEQFAQYDEYIRNGEIVRFEIFHQRKDKHYFQAQIECFPLQNDHEQIEFIFVMVSDITYKILLKQGNDLERKMFRAIEREKTLYEKLSLSCAFIDSTMGPDIFSTITMKVADDYYITSAVPFESSYTHLIPNGIARNYYKNLMQLKESQKFEQHKGHKLSAIHQQHALKQGLVNCWQIPIPIHTGEILGVITIFYKHQMRPKEFYNRFMTKVITLIGLAYTYEMKQQQIYHLAYNDVSTGLSNRHDFLRKLSEVNDGYILFVEPSEFSKFVELYGRIFGDEILKQLATKFEKIAEVNFIGLFSSSMLALHVVPQETTNKNYFNIFNQLSKEAISVFGNNIYVSLKVGVTKFDPSLAVEVLCRNAESALSHAKLKRGAQFVFYDETMQEKLKKELVILNELVEAIKHHEFEVYVQPKIELYRGRVSGMEALARWNSSKLGFISPSDFIPIAESAGLIREIDLHIIEKVLQWMQRRQYEGKKIVPIAVNISPDHFYHPLFIKGLQKLVAKYYADPKYIIIEVTESISLVDIEKAKDLIGRLRLMGFQTSVDDFGIGYSSLTYLQKLFFSELKIDQSFISKIHEMGTYMIVKSILQMAHSLQMTTVAEGIETKEQYETVKQLGCNIAQGYYFSKPVPLAQLDEFQLI